MGQIYWKNRKKLQFSFIIKVSFSEKSKNNFTVPLKTEKIRASGELNHNGRSSLKYPFSKDDLLCEYPQDIQKIWLFGYILDIYQGLNDDYADERADYVSNEVSLDYNAGFQACRIK